MAITLQKRQRIGDVKIIKVEGERDKEKEVMVRRGIVPPKLNYSNSQIPSFENDVHKDPDYPIETYAP